MTKAILYSGTRNASSWAMRAWLALSEINYPFEEIIVDIRRPQRCVNLQRVAGFSPSGTVPALVIDRQVIFDSMAIMEFANDISGGQLLPEDPIMRAVARSLIAWQHAGLSGICSRISFESAFYPYKRHLSDQEQAEVSKFCGVLEPILEAGSEPFLFGKPTLADFALAPTVIRLLRHEPDLSATPRSSVWMNTVIEHSPVKMWLAEADELPHIWFDDYLAPEEVSKLKPAEH